MHDVFVAALIVSLAAPAAAQEQTASQSAVVQPAPAATQSGVAQVVGWTEDEKADLNLRIRRFQGAVRSAVENGGARLADRAKQIVSEIELAMTGSPEINPVFVPGVGYHFDVQVPDILASTLQMYALLARRQQLDRTVGNSAAGEKVTANNVVKPDGMATPTAFDPNTEYATFVRQELVDAMIESSSVLRVNPNELLIVSARVPAYAQTNPLEHHRRVIMQISGADLLAFRQGQLTKEQVKERILEFRY